MMRPRVIMPVYNGIEYDGRVRRSAEAVSAVADVTVISLATERDPPSGTPYEIVTVDAAPRRERLARIRSHLRFWREMDRLARQLRPAVLHAHDYFMVAPGSVVARRAGARFVYDAHELIIPSPDERMGRREQVWYALERLTIRRADLVIAANEERAEMMRLHYGLRETPLVIRNIPPLSAIATREDVESPRLPARRPGVVRLVYQGDLALNRRVGLFVDAVARLGPGYELVMVGSGPDMRELEARIAASGAAERIVLLGRVPAAELPSIMRACDLGVITYPDTGYNNIYCAPNKLHEYAHAGLPMVASRNPVVERAFREFGIGVAADDVADAIANAATRLAELCGAIPRFMEANRWEEDATRLVHAYDAMLRGQAARGD